MAPYERCRLHIPPPNDTLAQRHALKGKFKDRFAVYARIHMHCECAVTLQMHAKPA